MVERIGVVSSKQLEAANALIDEALNKAGGNPTSRDAASVWVDCKREIQKNAVLLSLAHSFCDKNGYKRPKHCQIALRFPGERIGENLTWHIDKNHFDLLLGVYLNDNLEPNTGNFVVAVGSETLFLEEPRDGLEGTFEEIGIPPTQIMADAGEILSVHRMLCHGTAPNESSSYTRRVIWFRLHKTA